MLRSYVRSSSSIVHGRVNGLRSVPSSLSAVRVAAPNSSSTTHRCGTTRRLCTTHTSHLSPSHPISATSVSSPSIVRSPLSWSVGYEANGFRVEAKSAVKDFNLTVYQFRHLESDSLFFHIARADSDHAFSVAFRTPVTNSTGVAHILEHTVLCGSKRYPVRDPFFLLVRRSLKTFMNAMTAQDYTMYPFSTQNEKDYKNLLEVYLDACFFPLLNKLDFLQEGHRLEVAPSSTGATQSAAENGSADSSNHLSSLQIKGVVYNEMKGAMSDTSQLFISKLQEELFPTNSNHWNSGGEPSVIPTLTHDELKAFHQQCYNLENAVFISYGDGIPPLDLVNERVIQPILKQRKEQKTPPSTRPPPYQQEARFTAPKTVHATCPPDPLIPDPTKQTKVSQAYLCKPLSDLSSTEREVENFGLQMLSSLLLDTPTAPMYQSLIDPNIGSGYAPATGYDSSTTESTFAFGLQGIAESDVDDVLQRIESTLQQVARDGFPEERIEASLHQIEISLKHVRSHFGIGLLMRIIPAWAQGLDPIQQLRVNDLIQQLRKRLAEGPYFQQLIRKHLLDNPHRVTLIMKPDVDYAKKEIEAEQAKLREREKTLTADEKTRLIEEAQQLIQAQNSKQDTKGCQLPSLSIADIPTQAEIINLEELKDPSSDSAPSSTSAASSSPYLSLPRFVSLPQPSNGVGYIRGLVSAKRLPLALRPYLPLYTSFLTELGTQQRDYRELAHVLDMTTGGISAELHIFGHLNDLDQHEEMILFKSLALERNIGRMTELIREVLYQPFFNHYERLHQLLLQTSASCASSLQDSGSSYATSDASQYLFASANANECYNGIKNVQHINTIVARLTQSKTPEEIEGVLRDVAEKLKQISTILLEDGLERIFIVGDEGSMAELKKNVTTLFEKPKSSSSSSSSASSKLIDFPFQPTRTSQKSFYALPLQVNNVSMVLPTVPYTHPDAPRLDVMAKILSSVYVHREVREKGGAYGGHVSHSSDGILAFSSYRDPNTLRTLDAYRTAPGWLLGSDNFSSTDIEEALLSLFSTIDAPRPPAAKGLGQFLYGITNEQRQEYRERLLAVQKKDVLDVCQKYLTPKQLDAAHVTIVGDDTNVPEQISNGREWKVKSVDLGAAMAMSMEGEEGEFEEEEEQTRA